MRKVAKPSTGRNSQSNTNLEALSKNHSWSDYLESQSLRFFPQKADWRKRLIYSMHLFFEDLDNLEIMEFCIAYKIPYRTLRDWIAKYPEVKEAYEDVKLMLACRRRIGAIKRIYDKDMICKDLHRYDPEWDDVNKYNAKLKLVENNSGNTEELQKILERVLRPFEDSDRNSIKTK